MVESANPAQSRLESSDMSIDVTLQSKNTDTKSKHASVTVLLLLKRLRFRSLRCIIQTIEELFKGVKVETNMVPVNVRNPSTSFDLIYTCS